LNRAPKIAFIIITRFFTIAIICLTTVGVCFAQNRGFQLHPEPYTPGVDVDVEPFISDWRDSTSSRSKFGNLKLRDIYRPNRSGDPLKPSGRGEVLEVYKEFAQGFLAPNTATTPTTLEGEQAVFYVTSGKGEISAGGMTYGLGVASAILVPAGLEFTLKSLDEELSLLMVMEPIVGVFTPRKDLFVRHGENAHYSVTTSHWHNYTKPLIDKDDGLCVMHDFLEVLIMPGYMTSPHASLGLGTDVNWYCVEGGWTLLGKRLWEFEPGMAFKNVSDGRVYHANINTGEKPIKFLHIRSDSPQKLYGKYKVPQKADEYYSLGSNPDVNVDTDLFTRSWRYSEPRTEHAAIRVHDIFTENTAADPLKPEKDGAVLEVFSEYAWGILEPGLSSSEDTLVGEQKVFYFTAGQGEITGGGKTVPVDAYTAVLVPEGLGFQIKNSGTETLTMLILGEKTYKGFKPRKDMLVVKEEAVPFADEPQNWNYETKPIFDETSGMARLSHMTAAWLPSGTMSQIHATRGLGTDVLWLGLEGDTRSLLGKTLYRLEPGKAFKNPSDGKVYQGNINLTDDRVKLLSIRSIPLEQSEKLGE